eukprot:960491-Amphidinium_carterae.1
MLDMSSCCNNFWLHNLARIGSKLRALWPSYLDAKRHQNPSFMALNTTLKAERRRSVPEGAR